MKKEEEHQGEGQHWTSPSFIAPEIGEKPPVGVWIDKDPVCRDCMKVAEEVTMRRGFIDAIPNKEAQEKGYTCTRCGKKIATAS
jgi:hypothetical protein